MPLTTHIDRARDLRVVHTEGGCAYPEFEDALRALYADQPIRRLLTEFCAEGEVWTPDEVRQLVVFLASIRHSIPANSQVAVVSFTVADYGLARMAQILSELRIPWTLEVFRSREDALQWVFPEAPEPLVSSCTGSAASRARDQLRKVSSRVVAPRWPGLSSRALLNSASAFARSPRPSWPRPIR